MPDISILAADARDHRVLDAVCDGVPMVVVLDSSAAMKLMGSRTGQLEPLGESTSVRIAAAAERAIATERRVPPKVVLSALDFD